MILFTGSVGLIWCFAWWWVVRDSPEEDRKITDAELEYLRTAIGVSSQESLMSPPWKAMMTSKAVWAIIIAHFAENWGFYTLLTGELIRCCSTYKGTLCEVAESW